MDYVACGAGMEPDGMLGAGGDSGDERATRQVLLHVPLTLSLIKFLVGSIFSRELTRTGRPRQRLRGPSHKVPSGT